ncbi:MAG: ABC transporter substrate-binding protein [Candidatus Velamenicoccus archaeovorus]
MRKLFRVVVVLVVVGWTLSSCGGGEEGGGNGKGTPVTGGILRLGTSSWLDSLNPFKAWAQEAYNAFMHIYPVLVQYDADMDWAPDFATGWETSPDGTRITFTTAEGGTWSDGTPLTASDAAYTIDLMLRYPGPTSIMAGYAKHITSVEAPDDTTLVVNYDVPVNIDWALSQMNAIYILPEHVWSQHEGDDGKELRLWTNEAPIVSGGPFVLTDFVKKDFARFEVNPGYYGPEPMIDGFGIKYYSNDDAMVTAFLQGELDWIASAPVQAVDSIEANPDLEVVHTPGFEFWDVIFNSHEPLHREILDPKLREAFAHAIDMQAMLDTVFLGYGQLSPVIVPPATDRWHNADIPPVTYDPELANQMLDDLGFRMGPDGVRIANGHPMEYEVITPGEDLTGSDRVFEIMQEGLAEVGVRVKLKAMDGDAAWVAITGENNTYDGFDIAIWDWVPMPDPDFILSVLTCEQLGGWSDTGYCNPDYDDLYEAQGAAVDTAERQRIVREMQRIAYEDWPYIVLFYLDIVEAHASNWTGFIPTPQGAWNSLTKMTLEQVHRVS